MRYTQLLRTAVRIKDMDHFIKEGEKALNKAGRVVVKPGEGDPTGITGLYKHENPSPALVKVYDGTLELLKTKFPPSSVYRQSVENLTKARKSIVESSSTNEQIEQKIGSGLIEEILIQAGEEYELAKQLADQKPWEELVEKPEPGQWKYFELE